MSKADVDDVLFRISDYVVNYRIRSEQAYTMARYCLLDAMACLLLALEDEGCSKLMGPLVPGTKVPNGARVPGTKYCMDPAKAAFDIGTAIRWLDFNDAWFGAEGGHPSDNLGAILAVADYVSRSKATGKVIAVRDVLTALIKAYEIQGVLQLQNSFVNVGLDSTGLINIASTAVSTGLLGGGNQEVLNAVSNAWLDGISPRVFRMGHDTGWRKSWASGDMTRRGVMNAMLAMRGEGGYPRALSAKKWGFSDALLRGQPIRIARSFSSHIVENILFKIPFPAQFHTQTAIECALKLRPTIGGRIDDIKTIIIRTHERTLQSADKSGPLRNAADRDHCMQYILAVVLLKGSLESADYHDAVANDTRIDQLRSKMQLVEKKSFTRDFYDPKKRSNANSMQVVFNDGNQTPEIRVDYPLGHVRRRNEGLPLVEEKFRSAVMKKYASTRAAFILKNCTTSNRFLRMPIQEFIALFDPVRAGRKSS